MESTCFSVVGKIEINTVGLLSCISWLVGCAALRYAVCVKDGECPISA